VVGNRVLLFDLVKGVCSALPAQARKNITAIATDPQGTTLIAVDEDGKAILVSLAKRTVMTHFNFKGSVRCLKFSPDGRFLAVGIGKIVSVYKSPQLSMEFCPFHLFKSFSGPVDDILSLDWSKESKFLAVGSKDLTARVYAIDVDAGVRLRRLTLSGHRDYVVSVGFIDDTRLVSVARDGALFMWNILLDEAEGIFRSEFESKHLFPKQESGNGWTQIISADVFSSPGATLVVAGSSSGVFTIYSLPDFEQVHSLSISGHQISSVKMNPSGDWIAFGCPHLGQLLVWEWKSETYVLKQQGHLFDMKCLAYSPDGSLIATGGDDGKVKIWNASSGYCFVTFSDHTCSISDIAFSSRGNVVFSASLDGTVRAYDLVRYRCFRTFTAPSESIVQFTSVVCDPSGDIVCAGAMDPFEVFVWSLRTGQLLDVLSGHEGPISGLAFNTNRSLLVSSSWDKSVKVWDVFSTKTATETLMHGSDVVAVASSPCGNFICSSNLAGQLCFWDLATGEQVGLIEGKKDILGGRKRDDRRTWKNATDGLWFST
jgi:periodic tryptophan protein 2